jgi:hypothetical protein
MYHFLQNIITWIKQRYYKWTNTEGSPHLLRPCGDSIDEYNGLRESFEQTDEVYL